MHCWLSPVVLAAIVTDYGYQMVSEVTKEPQVIKDPQIVTITVSPSLTHGQSFTVALGHKLYKAKFLLYLHTLSLKLKACPGQASWNMHSYVLTA